MGFASSIGTRMRAGVDYVANGKLAAPVKIYGRALTNTYGPGLMATGVSLLAQRALGAAVGGTIGGAFIAPLVVPMALPLAITLGGHAVDYATRLTAKVAHKVLAPRPEPKQAQESVLLKSVILTDFLELPAE